MKKSQSGVSLISVIVYIFSMVIAVSTVMMLNSFFFDNILDMRGIGEISNQNNKFNMFFLNDMKECYYFELLDTNDFQNNNIQKLQFVVNQNSSETITYSLVNSEIYRNNVKIVDNVSDLKFEKLKDKNGLKVFIKFSYESQEKSYTTTYYLGRGY